ncbi:uncharacterized protein LOC113519257 [Galleria mellonella]|uniref:Uncharacterized protein LOC113519257 n=1 Tax=Galleria mellonella TaxID=7137 RepID=A0ABM3N219_GALME|nr:uncharacterized protein LOC113519257 [Galleria mellonella]
MRAVKSIPKLENDDEETDDDDDSNEDVPIQWSNLIFLPFHPVFKIIVLFSVILKTILGPIQSVYPIVYCSNVMDTNWFTSILKYYYLSLCDIFYFIDTLLHIIHRQVADKAVRREHLPKSALLLILDIISLIPCFEMVSSEVCPEVQLWPNVLCFNEFVIIYRVVEYFSLVTTHSFWKLFFGFTILTGICVNCVCCFWLLLTVEGLCANCRNGIYDWRKFVIHKLNETDKGYLTYVYGYSFVLSFVVNVIFDETKPSTILEYFVVVMFMICGYLLDISVIFPKLFAESMLSLRRICTYYPQILKIIDETRRRNPTPNAHVNVKNFYKLIWKKRNGITCIPPIISELPRYLRLDIKQDLVWPVFYHSPTFRKTSTPFKRWLCEFIRYDYKLPGEKIFTGPHCLTNLYYLKSGIVQLMSTDDGVTPLLSVTSGTIFGDISFFIPPLKRKITVRCLTYCEVLQISRYDILKGLHKYPHDRQEVIKLARNRINHARILYTCKQHVKGLDITEDEGIAWVKRRWWEISETIANYKKKSTKRQLQKYDLPPEEAVYHCAKYIGQLVLCSDTQLQTKSLFTKDKFPWLLSPDSTFIRVWKLIVVTTVFFVLILYPPNIVRYEMVNWFRYFKHWTDFIYAADICVSLFTSIAKQDRYRTNFTGVMFARCKSVSFVLDVLATIWIEEFTIIIGKSEYYHASQFNRLIKIYMLFWSDSIPHNFNVTSDPKYRIYCSMVLIHFSSVYVVGHFIYMLCKYIPGMSMSYFFGAYPCGTTPKIRNDSKCDPAETDIFSIAIAWTFELLFSEFLPHNILDIYTVMLVSYIGFLTYTFLKSRFIAFLYLKYRNLINYQFFVSNLKKYYEHHKIHRNLMRRLNRYLDCHWKYYKGIDVMHPHLLKDEPYDIYWKVHGEIAEKIIGHSVAFAGAEYSLVRELAYASKFLILPKSATLFLFGVSCKNVTWIVQGYVKIEYHNEDGELLKTFYGPGQMVSVTSVLLGQPSQRTYTSCTECEILYINLEDFFNIIKRYPNEWSYFHTCIHEYRPLFYELFQVYVKKHSEYQKRLRDRIFHAVTTTYKEPLNELVYEQEILWSPLKSDYFLDPESDFIRYWMLFRVVTVVVSITTASLQGGSGAMFKWPLTIISTFCDCIAWIDIIIKLFLAYYDENGILIYSKRRCVWNYLSRGFLMDVIGTLPVFELCRLVLRQKISIDQIMLINTVCKFAHLYILTGYFNYIADVPSINSGYLLILKWQIVTILIMLGGSHYLISYCIEFTFDAKDNLIHMARRNTCWIPSYMVLDNEPTVHQLHLLFAESINLAQSGLMKMNMGKFRIERNCLGVGFTLFVLGILFWYVICYTLTILVLTNRGDTLYQHNVSQLWKFLQAERVDKKLIHHAVAHFSYWWIRTKGINIQNFINSRIGLIFRQDLNYYFFKKTFKALDSIINCGEPFERLLSSVCSQMYYLPSQEIVREMDLSPYIFIVHRGKVAISQDEENLAVLTKGAIFGQLKGIVPRPVRISAVADGYADILQIPIKQFHDIIDDKVRENINRNYQSEDDYMETKKRYYENPYNTVRYILRGRKTIKLPWMLLPMEARSRSWYSKWLTVVWLCGPFVSAVIVLILNTLPIDCRMNAIWILLALDLLHLAHFLSEFYTMELTVIHDKCVNQVVGLRMFKKLIFYVDILSLVVPLMTLVTGNWTYQIARLLRLHLLYQFHMHFCRSFKSKAAPLLMKFIILFLLLHSMICGWIYVGCRSEFTFDFPVPILDVPEDFNKTIDYQEWQNPKDRQGGCARITRNFKHEGESRVSFVVPKSWQHDYIVALNFIILLHTHTVLDTVMTLSIAEVYYKIFINFFIYLIDIWLMSTAVSAVYTMFRELYQYDFNVSNLTSYLNHSGLSPALLKAVKKYTKQLWRRQKGNWLPELAHQAPMCLREDLLSALYMHHIQTPPLFRLLPQYFARQLVARVQRIVIFPNKCIVQEGDIFSCIYFIHEGEVEKWFTDSSGEKKMISLLSSNGYFGFIPGLFPNTPFQFTYYTRTVVDLIYLRLSDWQDLLNAFPDVKQTLYAGARELKKDLLKI